jgi:hypothetical protein
VTPKIRRLVFATVAMTSLLGLGLPAAAQAPAKYALPPDPNQSPLPPDPEPVPEPDGTYQSTVLRQGAGWQLLNARGQAVDDAGQTYDRNLYVLNGASGANAAPLPAGVQAALASDVDAAETAFVLDQQIVDELALSEQQGYLTPFLQSIAEPADDPEPLPLDGLRRPIFGRCSDKVINKSKTFSVASPIDINNVNWGPDFTGQFHLNGNVQGSGTGEVQVRLKRYSVFWVCIPYGVRLDYARANGFIDVGHASTINGFVNFDHPDPWVWDIAKPKLFTLDFFIGPIPVHIGFNLPIKAGLALSANATGSLTYHGDQTAHGSFDYRCTTSGCTGSSSFVGTNDPQEFSGSVGGHIKPTVYAEVAVRGYLYSEWVAYAQAGVRPYLYGDLWGYYGNTCGDADGDGFYETVDALTFDLDWQLKVTAAARVFGATPTNWTLWTGPYRHAGFWDLIGSRALRPMLAGPASVPVNGARRYEASLRPCWPYAEPVNYTLNWGDGTAANLSGAPQSATPIGKAWTSTGAKNVQLTVGNDSHGRHLNATTERVIQVGDGTGTWTAWMDRDDPSGTGDWETLADFPAGSICGGATPIDIQCRTLSGVDWTVAGEVYSCTPGTGGICQNRLQTDGACLDYEVRFLCQ